MSRVGNWLGENTTTVGQGPISLGGQIDGYATFSTLGDGLVYYAIVDGNNREVGIGTIAAGELQRTTVNATLVDGAYNGVSPDPIALTGTAQVFGTFNKQTFDDLSTRITAAQDKADQNEADILVLDTAVSALDTRITQNENNITQLTTNTDKNTIDIQSVRPPGNYIDNAAFFVSQHGSPLTLDGTTREIGACDGWFIKSADACGGAGCTLTAAKANVTNNKPPYNHYSLTYGGTFATPNIYFARRTGNAFDFNDMTVNVSCEVRLPATGNYDLVMHIDRKFVDGSTSLLSQTNSFTVSDVANFTSINQTFNVPNVNDTFVGAVDDYTEVRFEIKLTGGGNLPAGEYVLRKPQVTIGPNKQDFIYNNISRELVTALRDYQNSFRNGEIPRNEFGNTADDMLYMAIKSPRQSTPGSERLIVRVDFPIPFRMVPTVTIYSQIFGNPNSPTIYTGGTRVDLQPSNFTVDVYEKLFILTINVSGLPGNFENDDSFDCYFNWAAEYQIPA